jgi:threonine synthase
MSALLERALIHIEKIMSALPTSLQLCCHVCGRQYNDRWVWRCHCGSPLDFAVSQTPDGEPPASPTWRDTTDGLWAFTDLLPVEPTVSLGEGLTPLVNPPQGQAPGLPASTTLSDCV